MGSSASILCKSAKLRDKMVTFLTENMKSHVELFDAKRNRFSGIVAFEGIKYGGSANSFGWNSPGDLEFAILRWAALRVGKSKKFKDLPESVPYVDDDGQFKIPVILKGSPNDIKPQEYESYDTTGYAPLWRWYFEEEIQEDPEIRQIEERLAWREIIIKHELLRLTELWERQ